MIKNAALLKSILFVLIILLFIYVKSLQHISLFSIIIYSGIASLFFFKLSLLFFTSTQEKSIKDNNNDTEEIDLRVYTNETNTPQNECNSLMVFHQICHGFFTNNPSFTNSSLENGNNVVFDLDDKLPTCLDSNKIQLKLPELKSIIKDYIKQFLEEDEENFAQLNKCLLTHNIQVTKLISNDYYKKRFVFDDCLNNKGFYSVFYGDNKRLNVLINRLIKCHSHSNSSSFSPSSNLIDLLKQRILLNERVMSDMLISIINNLHLNLHTLYSFKRLREIVNNSFHKDFYNNKGGKLYGRDWSNAFPTDTQLIAAVIVNLIGPKSISKIRLMSFPEIPDYMGKNLYIYQKNPKEKEPYFCVFYKDAFIPGALEDNFFYSLQLYLKIGTDEKLFYFKPTSNNYLLKQLLLDD